jgi:hypothetical protein
MMVVRLGVEVGKHGAPRREHHAIGVDGETHVAVSPLATGRTAAGRPRRAERVGPRRFDVDGDVEPVAGVNSANVEVRDRGRRIRGSVKSRARVVPDVLTGRSPAIRDAVAGEREGGRRWRVDSITDPASLGVRSL